MVKPVRAAIGVYRTNEITAPADAAATKYRPTYTTNGWGYPARSDWLNWAWQLINKHILRLLEFKYINKKFREITRIIV